MQLGNQVAGAGAGPAQPNVLPTDEETAFYVKQLEHISKQRMQE